MNRLDALIQIWKQGSRNPDNRSVADRLRPPYQTPVPWLQPQNAPASVNVEQGFNRLPSAYQNLMRETPPGTPIPVGTLQPDAWNVRGLFSRGRAEGDHGLPAQWMVAEDGRVASHEMIHALSARNQFVRDLVPKFYEEQLARHIGGQPSGLGNAAVPQYKDQTDIPGKVAGIDSALTFTGDLPRSMRALGPWLFRGLLGEGR